MASALTQKLLPLTLTAAHNPPPNIAAALPITANNILRSVWPLTLGLIDAQRQQVIRLLADGAVLANLFVSGAFVGGAVGGYGIRVLLFLPQVPLEWAGLATGAVAWLIEREQRLYRGERQLAAMLIATVLLCAAIVETYLAPHQ